jgi:hypothetical protein
MALPVQGIPTMSNLTPPADADVTELAGAAPRPAAQAVAAKPAAVKTAAPKSASPRGRAFKVQLASAKSAAGAKKEIGKLHRRFGTQVAELKLSVERAPRGLYRVVSQPMAEQRAARDVCVAMAAQHGSCLVVATRAVPASPVPAAATTLVAAKALPHAAPVRAQLASLRSFEGAARELDRLTRRYGDVLDHTSLTISRIDQGGRGTFYRVLTAPLPDRDAATGLCQRIALQAGCVLIRDRHREALLIGPSEAGAGPA